MTQVNNLYIALAFDLLLLENAPAYSAFERFKVGSGCTLSIRVEGFVVAGRGLESLQNALLKEYPWRDLQAASLRDS